MGRTGYTRELRARPFGMYCSATLAQQHASLREHPDKLALIALFCHDQQTEESKFEGSQLVQVTMNIKSCEDCHAFFIAASALQSRLLVLRERRKVAHEMDNGRYRCQEILPCEARRRCFQRQDQLQILTARNTEMVQSQGKAREELMKKTVLELKAMCRERALKVGGVKKLLIERLLN